MPAVLATAIAARGRGASGRRRTARSAPGASSRAAPSFFRRKPASTISNVIVDLLAREELAGRPADWLRLQAGFEFRANNADQVDDSWQPDIRDRGIERPLLSVRRLTRRSLADRLTIDAGKQFIRWGKTEIVTPTDRFAPRDYLNVFDTEYLAVPGVRVARPAWRPLARRRCGYPCSRRAGSLCRASAGPCCLRMRRRSRASAARFPKASRPASGGDTWRAASKCPRRSSTASITCRSSSPSDRCAFRLTFPSMRMYGGDAVVPSRWVTIKGEGGYFTQRRSRRRRLRAVCRSSWNVSRAKCSWSAATPAST